MEVNNEQSINCRVPIGPRVFLRIQRRRSEIPVRVFEHVRDQKGSDPVSTGRTRRPVLCGPQRANFPTNAGDYLSFKTASDINRFQQSM